MTGRGPGEAILFVYRLKPGMGPDYDEAHKAVWPEIRELIDKAGIYDYQIWRCGDLVVSRMRTRQGYAHAAAVTGASAVQKAWTDSIRHIFVDMADADGAPLWLEEVFSHRVLPAGEHT
jgi:L-rhamnose mutarotase